MKCSVDWLIAVESNKTKQLDFGGEKGWTLLMIVGVWLRDTGLTLSNTKSFLFFFYFFAGQFAFGEMFTLKGNPLGFTVLAFVQLKRLSVKVKCYHRQHHQVKN